MASEGGCEGEPVVDGGELLAGSSGSGFGVGCTNSLSGTCESSTSAGGGLPGTLGTALGRRDKSTCLCPDFNSCSGPCNGCQGGTVMPQPELTRMASAAGSGDGDWPFLSPRLTVMTRAPGDSVFVVPPAACSTIETILPRFVLGVLPVHNLQAWNPRQAQPAHEAKKKQTKK